MSIVLEQLSKRYDGLVVVDRVSLNVADGELFVLLGTSGSGKSTILRLIAGLADPDSGSVVLHGRDVTHLSPQQRGTGFVFQNYSIFRHMNVAENIEFGLKVRGTSASARAAKRDDLLGLVGMAGLGARYADQLSGGQQQRVALARALAYEPNVLLLDEPFGALDVKTRGQLRRSLKEVQRKLKVTAILVTHDQDEAFELGDRIGVLDLGRLLEVGEPEALYARPRTLFAATFLGAGTVFVGRARNHEAHFGSVVLPIPAEAPHDDGAPVQLLFRPEQVVLSAEEPVQKRTLLGQGTIIEQGFVGALRRIRVRLPRLAGTRQVAAVVPFGEEDMFVDTVVPADARIATEHPWVSLRGWHILNQSEPRLLLFDQGEGSAPALAFARTVSEQMAGVVTLLGVAGDSEGVEARRAQLIARQQEAGIPDAEVRVRVGEAADQILAEEREAVYSMVMLAPSAGSAFAAGHGPLERRRGKRLNRLGPTLIRLLEQPVAPVMVVKKPRPQLKRMLICTAVGEPGKSDVRVGGRLARRLGATVTLLHVMTGGDAPAPLVQTFLRSAAATLRALDVRVEVKIQVAETPVKGILAAAREGDHDLVLVGNHGPQSRSIFGRDDVTLQVLVGSDRPVLVVPPEEG